jgi:hypothetical protein
MAVRDCIVEAFNLGQPPAGATTSGSVGQQGEARLQLEVQQQGAAEQERGQQEAREEQQREELQEQQQEEREEQSKQEDGELQRQEEQQQRQQEGEGVQQPADGLLAPSQQEQEPEDGEKPVPLQQEGDEVADGSGKDGGSRDDASAELAVLGPTGGKVSGGGSVRSSGTVSGEYEEVLPALDSILTDPSAPPPATFGAAAVCLHHRCCCAPAAAAPSGRSHLLRGACHALLRHPAWAAAGVCRRCQEGSRDGCA